MKQKITYSRFSAILTVLVLGLLLIGCVATVNDRHKFFILLPVFLILVVSALFYGASYIRVDEDHIVLGSVLRGAKIALNDVESVEMFQPAKGAVRIFASGGFMGYWGMFNGRDIGRYYGFYGRASDCFLVRMKDGGKYVLGCDHPEEMVARIRSLIGG